MPSSSKKTARKDFIEGDTVSEGDTSDEEGVGDRKDLQIPHGGACDDSNRTSSSSQAARDTRRRRKIICITLVVLAVAVLSATIVGVVLMAKSRKQPSSLDTTGTSVEKEASTVSPISDEIDSSVVPTEADIINTRIEQPPQEEETQNTSDEGDDSDSSSSTETAPEVDTDIDAVPAIDTDIEILDEFVDYNVTNDTTIDEVDEDTKQTTWPGLVGMTGEEAKAQLVLLYGEGTYNIVVMNYNSPTTKDYRHDRIRIFTDDEGVVSHVPRIG